MAMINNYGLNYVAKNRIRRYKAKGMNVQEIAARVRATPELIERYLRSLEPPAPKEASTDADQDADEFGPLPGTPQWQELPPGKKSAISRARNSA